MFSLSIMNANGTKTEITHTTDKWVVVGVQGLTYPATNVNTQSGASLDGGIWNSSIVNMREITITIVLQGNIEENRQELYNIFLPKKPLVLYYSNKNRSVAVKGYVETLEADLFVQQEQVQIGILCPSAFLNSAEVYTEELSIECDPLEFPLTIEDPSEPLIFANTGDNPTLTIRNYGEFEIGLLIEITVKSATDNILITNTANGDYIKIEYSFLKGDFVTINTNRGELGVMLKRGSTEISLLNYMDGSWLKAPVGDNVYSISNNAGYDVKITWSELFGGV